MKQDGLEAMTRKQVDDIETRSVIAEQKFAKCSELHDHSRKTLFDL